eukprot:7190853-Pyramimonas_sp.AAC.1
MFELEEQEATPGEAAFDDDMGDLEFFETGPASGVRAASSGYQTKKRRESWESSSEGDHITESELSVESDTEAKAEYAAMLTQGKRARERRDERASVKLTECLVRTHRVPDTEDDWPHDPRSETLTVIGLTKITLNTAPRLSQRDTN